MSIPIGNSLKISFIIPVLKASDILFDCIESIFQQQTSFPFEVIVVDNSSNGANTRFFSSLNGQYADKNLRVLSCLKMGAGVARNFGAYRALGDFLAFIDYDVVLEHSWAQTLIDEIGDFPFSCACAPIVPATKRTRLLDKYRWSKVHSTTLGTFLSPISKIVPFRPAINSAACIYRRTDFFLVGGFKEELKRFEDVELSLRGFFAGFHFLVTDKTQAKVYYEFGVLSYLLRSFKDGYNAPKTDFVTDVLIRAPRLLWWQKYFYYSNTLMTFLGLLLASLQKKNLVYENYVLKKSPRNLTFDFYSDKGKVHYVMNPEFRVCRLLDEIILTNGALWHSIPNDVFFRSLDNPDSPLSSQYLSHPAFRRISHA